MTFQPPPPPPGDNPPPPPPPPPPGQWGPPPGGAGHQAFDPKNVNRLDWGILAAGFLVFIFSFISFYSGGKVTCGGRSISLSGGSASAWHDIIGGGFFGWFAMVFAVAGAVAVAMELFAPQVKFPIANRLAALGLFGLALLFEIIGIFVTPSDSAFGCSASVGHGAGFWISLILILAGTGMALMRAQQTGTALPGPLSNIPPIGPKTDK
jgi:hypothetical protein